MQKKFSFPTLLAALALVVTVPTYLPAGQAASKNVILSTTTSTQDSGLLDVLVPLFEKKSGTGVKTVSVGTGQALELAAKGEADVALVHAPTLEKIYVAEGKLLNRRLVMYNDFIILGPANDRRIKSTRAARRREADRAMRAVSFSWRQLRHPQP
jgi:tungstate transport system substrate-binding protein